MDGKKFLFLSRRQRWTISLGLGSLLAAALLGVVYAPVAVDGQVQRLGNVSADALKLLLTAAAGWVLVLLYTSSNSFGRIERETVAFLTRDLCRPAERRARPGAVDDNAPMVMQCLATPVPRLPMRWPVIPPGPCMSGATSMYVICRSCSCCPASMPGITKQSTPRH